MRISEQHGEFGDEEEVESHQDSDVDDAGDADFETQQIIVTGHPPEIVKPTELTTPDQNADEATSGLPNTAFNEDAPVEPAQVTKPTQSFAEITKTTKESKVTIIPTGHTIISTRASFSNQNSPPNRGTGAQSGPEQALSTTIEKIRPRVNLPALMSKFEFLTS